MKECLNDILAVLVLYRRELTATETFVSLSCSVASNDGPLDLFVYDNSPTSTWKKEEFKGWRIYYRHDPSNPGVSKAYNEGCHLARRLGKKWLLLLDQDTEFPGNALDVYCRGIESHPSIVLFGPVLKNEETICSPSRYLMRTGFHPKRVGTGMQRLRGRAVLNSGMLVRVDAFERSGGFNEQVRLDFADFVFNNRLRKHYDNFCVLPLECRHGFSGAGAASLEDALQRFELFRSGAQHSIETVADRLLYGLVVLKRCLRLTVQFRSLRFMKACFARGAHAA